MSFRRILRCSILSLLIQLTVSLTAFAWEFSLSGSLTWTYETYSQQGRSGFFGPYDVDASAIPYSSQYYGTRYPNSAANLNLWNGISRAFNRQMASGTDVAISYLQGDFWPVIKINPAIDIRGRFLIGNYQNKTWYNPVTFTGEYQYRTWSNPGTMNDMSFAWPLLWGTAQTPWGMVSYGKRPMAFGTGLQYDGESNLTSESLSLKTYYGPLNITLGFYPYRQAPYNSYSQVSSFAINVIPPPVIRNNSTNYYGSYYNVGDKSGIREKDLCASVVYSSGNLEIGVYEAYFTYHVGPEGLLQESSWSNLGYLTRDTDVSHGNVYTKYFNGRFFANVEAAWFYETSKYGGHSPTYIEQWRYMAELGVVTGPTKLGFLVAFSPGLDRRNGAYIDRQPAGFLRQPALSNELAGITIWRQYAYLLPYVYGSGLAGYSRDLISVGPPAAPSYLSTLFYDRFNQGLNQEGYMLDALVLAGRLDYAVASNLNVFASFFTAERVSRGYPWGFISPQYAGYPPDPSPFFENYPTYTGNVMLDFSTNSLAPSIPDTSLGYEIDLGFAWNLLENWKIEVVASRWKPGKWFSYACIDKSTQWRTPTASNNYGTNPGRTIDAIMALRVDLISNF